MNQSKSNVGDWLFLISSVGLVGGYFAYENAAGVTVWLESISNAPILPAGGLLAFLIGNWGLVLLAAAIIFAVFKLWFDGSSSSATGGKDVIKYKTMKHVSVKLIR